MTHQDEPALLRELRKKFAGCDTTNFGIADFLARFGSPVDAVMYARLFWPKFTRFAGMVFRAETLESDDDRQRVSAALAKYSGDRTRTEEAFNAVDIPADVFARHGAESDDDVDAFLAHTLASTWNAKLQRDFPQQQFNLRLLRPDDNDGQWGVVFSIARAPEMANS